jgi:Asp-tRNA(Asn)/Glu-tRNA(Gln) amidotransferase C subunit
MNQIEEAYRIENEMNARINRRNSSEVRYVSRIESKENAAENLIGEIHRDGKMVSYINQIDRNGRFTGKTIEGSRANLVSYCIKNKYV